MPLLRSSIVIGMLAVMAGGVLTARECLAQAGGVAHAADPRAQNLARLMKPVTIELTDARLDDLVTFIQDATGAMIDAKWRDDSGEGLDPEQTVSVSVRNVSYLTLLERVLEKAQRDAFSQNTWQMASTGEIEIGPKSRLNRAAYVKLYDINDLLFVTPSFTDAPRLDLDSVLNQGQGGGGQGSIFTDDAGDPTNQGSRDERAQEIIDIIIATVDPDQWQDNGGDAASIRHIQGHLMVRAPDYMHREIDGYPWWPQGPSPSARGGRYFTGSFSAEAAQTTFDNAQQPSTGGGTGGGGATPGPASAPAQAPANPGAAPK